MISNMVLKQKIKKLKAKEDEIDKKVLELERRESDLIFKHERANGDFRDDYSRWESIFTRVPLNYFNTVFTIKRDELKKHITGTLLPYNMTRSLSAENHLYGKANAKVLKVAVHCDEVISTDEGPVLIVSDPYRSLKIKPLKNTSFETAFSWKSKIIIAELMGVNDLRTDLEAYLLGVKVLRYTLYGYLDKNNVEVKFETNKAIIPKFLDNHICVKGKENAIKYIDAIAKQLNFEKRGFKRESKVCIKFGYTDPKLYLQTDKKANTFYHNASMMYQVYYKPESNKLEVAFTEDSTINYNFSDAVQAEKSFKEIWPEMYKNSVSIWNLADHQVEIL